VFENNELADRIEAHVFPFPKTGPHLTKQVDQHFALLVPPQIAQLRLGFDDKK
jgi:hypothetical protein